jgi:CSLREA domain-containing protein
MANRRRISQLVTIALVISVLLCVKNANAATFTVNTLSDISDGNAGNGVCETAPGNSVCTLRGAIQEANALGGDNIIILPSLPAPAVYVLTIEAPITITSNLTITGAGAATTIIDGNKTGRPNSHVFHISSGVVSISGVTIRNDYDGDGKADIAAYTGGAWSIKRSSDNGNTVLGHGGPTWVPVPADYDGDGKVDVAVYEPNGAWSIKRSSDNGMTVVGHGGPQDEPLN